MIGSHKLSTYPLHCALHEHKVKSFFNLAQSVNERNIHQRDCFNRTLLDIAVTNGQVQVALHLLAKKADVNNRENPYPNQKTPLYLAIEHNHIFLAHILLLFGADKTVAIHLAKKLNQSKVSQTLIELKPNKEILCALFFWVAYLGENKSKNQDFTDTKMSILQILTSSIQTLSIKNQRENYTLNKYDEKNSWSEDKKCYDETNINLEVIKDDLEGLMELAAHLGDIDLTEVFYETNNRRFRVNPASPTTAYWVAEHGYGDFYKNYIAKDDQLVAETLRQLKHKNPIAWDLATPKQIQLYENLEEVLIEFKQLTKRQNKVLIAAKWANKEALLRYANSKENLLAILVFAYQKKEFVAFKSLMKMVDYKNILKHALTNNLKELFFIVMLLNNQEPYMLARENTLNTINFDHLIPYQSTSILNQFILHSSSTLEDTRSRSARKKQEKYFKSQNVTVVQFIRSYCFIRFKKEITNKNDLLTNEKLNLRQKLDLMHEAKKLGFNVIVNLKKSAKKESKFFNIFFQKNSPFSILDSFLDGKSKFNLATTATHFFRNVYSYQDIGTDFKGLSEYFKNYLKKKTWMERLNSQPFSLSCTLNLYLDKLEYAGGILLFMWFFLSLVSLILLYQMIECSIGSRECSPSNRESLLTRLIVALSLPSIMNLFIPQFSRTNVPNESYCLLSLLLLNGFDETELQNLENFVANFNAKTSIKIPFHQLIDNIKKAYPRFNIHNRLTVKEMKNILPGLEKEISYDMKMNRLILSAQQDSSPTKEARPSLADYGFFEIKSASERVLSYSSRNTTPRESTTSAQSDITVVGENEIRKDEKPANPPITNRSSFG